MKVIGVVILLLLAACDCPDRPIVVNELCRLSFDPDTSERIVIDCLRSARISIDIALYGFDNDPVADELVAAARRGVRVRCVSEYDSESSASWQRLIAESRQNTSVSLRVVFGNSSGIMHNKYFVIDGVYLISGSTNLTQGMYRHFNNLVLIKSAALAADYLLDFEVLFAGYNAAAKGNDLALDPLKNGFNAVHGAGRTFDEEAHVIGDMSVTAYFTPYKALFSGYRKAEAPVYVYFDHELGMFSSRQYDNAMNILFPLLRGAQQSITVFSFSLTDKVFMQELSDAGQRGVQVTVLSDHSQFASSLCHSGRSLVELSKKISALRLCRRPDGGLLHHKVIIIDGDCVVLGSLNFSNNAVSDNDENFLVFRNAPSLAKAFLAERVEIEKYSYSLYLTEEELEKLQSGCGEEEPQRRCLPCPERSLP